MQFTEFNSDIPSWVKEHMLLKCNYCGSYIVDNGNENPDHEITARRCANPNCPGHMQYKVAYLAKHFGIDGIGPATALDMIKTYSFKSHLDAIPIWFTKSKPVERLGTIADLACIEGYGTTKATRDLNCFQSFTDYFNSGREIDKVLWSNREHLKSAESHFTIAPPLARNKINVMMTGSFNGFSNRKDYLTEINNIFGEAVQVVDVGKRKTGVQYLIREHNAVDRSKTALARELGIPIVTPQEFIDILIGATHT